MKAFVPGEGIIELKDAKKQKNQNSTSIPIPKDLTKKQLKSIKDLLVSLYKKLEKLKTKNLIVEFIELLSPLFNVSTYDEKINSINTLLKDVDELLNSEKEKESNSTN